LAVFFFFETQCPPSVLRPLFFSILVFCFQFGFLFCFFQWPSTCRCGFFSWCTTVWCLHPGCVGGSGACHFLHLFFPPVGNLEFGWRDPSLFSTPLHSRQCFPILFPVTTPSVFLPFSTGLLVLTPPNPPQILVPNFRPTRKLSFPSPPKFFFLGFALGFHPPQTTHTPIGWPHTPALSRPPLAFRVVTLCGPGSPPFSTPCFTGCLFSL